MKNFQKSEYTILLKAFIFLFIFSGFCLAQKIDLEKEKQELRKLDERWMQFLLEQNLDMIKDFYPENYEDRGYTGFKESKWDYQKTYDEFKIQFQSVKYLSIKKRQEPEYFFSDDRTVAWYYVIYDVEQLIKKTKKTRKFSIGQFSVMTKRNGKWLWHSNMEEFKNERKEYKVDKLILDDYAGTYQADDGRAFQVSTDDSLLIFKNEAGDEHKYSAQSAYVFSQVDGMGTIVFGRNKKGEVSHYSSFWGADFYGTRKKIK